MSTGPVSRNVHLVFSSRFLGQELERLRHRGDLPPELCARWVLASRAWYEGLVAEDVSPYRETKHALRGEAPLS